MTTSPEKPPASPTTPRINWRGILSHTLTHILTLIVGAAIGYLTYYLTIERPKLGYEVISSNPFAGKDKEVSILAVKIYNDGNKEAEEVAFRIRMGADAKIDQFSVKGVPSDSYSSTVEDSQSILIKLPFLNPADELTAQLLLSSQKVGDSPIFIELRGKGVTGVRRAREPQQDISAWIMPALGALLGCLAVATTTWQAYYNSKEEKRERRLLEQAAEEEIKRYRKMISEPL